MVSYRLTRDDGALLRVTGNTWESALELGYLYGWTPAGAEPPRTEEWLRREAGAAPWDPQDYFSRQVQHVEWSDARALAAAVARALSKVQGPRALAPTGATRPSVLPTRASAVSDGLSTTTRNALVRFVDFAKHGGFTIGGSR